MSLSLAAMIWGSGTLIGWLAVAYMNGRDPDFDDGAAILMAAIWPLVPVAMIGIVAVGAPFYFVNKLGKIHRHASMGGDE